MVVLQLGMAHTKDLFSTNEAVSDRSLDPIACLFLICIVIGVIEQPVTNLDRLQSLSARPESKTFARVCFLSHCTRCPRPCRQALSTAQIQRGAYARHSVASRWVVPFRLPRYHMNRDTRSRTSTIQTTS